MVRDELLWEAKRSGVIELFVAFKDLLWRLNELLK